MRFLHSTTRLCSLLHNVLPTLPVSTTNLLELACFYAYTFTAIHCLEANHMLVQKKMSIYYYACAEEYEHTIMLYPTNLYPMSSANQLVADDDLTVRCQNMQMINTECFFFAELRRHHQQNSSPLQKSEVWYTNVK